MHESVRQAADKGDRERIKFVFVDCLDVDPTFREYQEDFDYCRKKGLFDSHQELTKWRASKSEWDENYWFTLKKDFQKNASVERLNHMREVAKVFLADKVKRLEHERMQVNEPTTNTASQGNIQAPAKTVREVSGTHMSPEQEKELKELRDKLAAENRETEQRSSKPSYAKQSSQSSQRKPSYPKEEGMGSALLIGVGAALAAVAAIILLKR